jgi:hypothetical protein
MVEVIRWPDGAKMWRVIGDLTAHDLEERIIGSTHSSHIRWDHWGYDTGEMVLFVMTVNSGEPRFLDIPVLLLEVKRLDRTNEGVLYMPENIRVYRDAVYVDRVREGLSAKLLWFIYTVLDLDPIEHGTSKWDEAKIRLGLPYPVADKWWDFANVRWGPEFIEAYKAWKHAGGQYKVAHPHVSPERKEASKVTFKLENALRKMLSDMWELRSSLGSKEVFREGPFHSVHISGNSIRLEIDRVVFWVTFALTPFEGLLWSVSWSFNSITRGSVGVPLLEQSGPSLLAVLQEARAVWPASDFDAMLDRWLEPGTQRYRHTEAYDLLDEPTPLLWAPERFWGWAKHQPESTA